MRTIIVTPESVNFGSPQVSTAILQHIVEHADIVGQDWRGRPVLRFEFAAEPWMVDKLACLGAPAEDLEDDDPAEDSGVAAWMSRGPRGVIWLLRT